MDGYSLWEFDLKESIIDFAERPFSADSALGLMNSLGLGEVSFASGPVSIDKLLFVYAHSDYAFTTDDLSWIAIAGEVVTANNENGLKVYSIELKCDEEEYYLCCAAIIKIFNIVLPDKNVFVFKVGSSFAIGTPRSFHGMHCNSFCVSGLVNAKNYLERQEFLSELQFADPLEVPEIVIRYSPQEAYAEPIKIKGIREIDPDYLQFLDEVKSYYGEDTESERQRYLSSHEDQITDMGNYRDACKLLANTAEADDSSSYEELEKAEIAAKKVSSEKRWEQVHLFDQDHEPLFDPSVPDADEVLKEILEKRF